MTTTPPSASIWAVIRAGQKDEHYVGRLAAALGEALKTLVGVRAWINYQERVVVPGTALLYRLLTTGSGRQTLGEEYCSLLQITESKQTGKSKSSISVPSSTRRLLLCLLTSLHAHLLNSFIALLKSIFERYFHHLRPVDLDDLRSTVQYVFATAQAINNAAFYFTGRYLELSKRLLSIGYLSTSGGVFFRGQTSSNSTSTLLGCLSALQVVLSLYSRYGLIASSLSSSSSKNQEPSSTPPFAKILSDDSKNPAKSCLLCLSPRHRPTLLPCGHIFCWPCLTSWLQFRAECPTCRRGVAENSRLVYLHNYS